MAAKISRTRGRYQVYSGYIAKAVIGIILGATQLLAMTSVMADTESESLTSLYEKLYTARYQPLFYPESLYPELSRQPLPLTLVANERASNESEIQSGIPSLVKKNNQAKTTQTQRQETDSVPFEAPLFTENKLHQYLGLTALGFVTVAILAPKEEGGLHENAAKASAFFGAATVTSGLISHWEEIDSRNGWTDPDNLHALLAGIGAAGMAVAAAKGPEGGHAGIGALGAMMMLYAVKITW